MEQAYKEFVSKAMELVTILHSHKAALNKDFKVNHHSTGEISLRQQQILMFIIKLNRRTVKDMAEDMAISPSTLSLMLKKLISSGYIEKEGDVNDKRNAFFNATDKGVKIYNVCEDIIIDALKCIYESYSSYEQEQLFLGFSYLRSTTEKFHYPLTMDNLFYEILNFSLLIAYQSRRYGIIHNIKSVYPVSESNLQVMDLIHVKSVDTIKRLTHIMGLSKGTLSITVKNLEAMGYVKKAYGNDSNLGDNRYVRLSLTKEGVKCLECVSNIMIDFYYGLWKDVPKKKQDLAIKGINIIYSVMKKRE